ncbi:MAG: DUF6600 domain-containing protein, partial [Acidobacteriota bacterium]
MRPPTFRPAIPFLLLAGALLAPGQARAQREGYTYLSFVGPEVSLVSPADEDAAARINMPVLPGDVLVTGSGSRAEAVLSDGNVVRLDGRSELRFERLNRTYESDDDRTILVLARGSVAVEVREAAPDRALRLDTDDATIVSPARSFFRVDAGRRGTEVYVLTGRVELNGRGGRVLVRAGEYAYVSADTDVEVEAAAVPRDRFTRFLEERYDRADRRDVKRYVGSEYSYDYDAADFEANGTWVYVPSAGTTCWRPNVPPDWTPYSLGTWRRTPAGLTWVSYESWGWLPYHYGMWAWDPDLGWYWIPGSLYAPAWVYWSYGEDWTGWCPVGWYGGYYDTYYRSTRLAYGNERGGPWLPNLRGKVEVTQIDRRGWNFAPTSRIGSRLDSRDVTRGDRVPFPRGATVVVTSAPLRVERGASPSFSVPEAIRRTSSSDAAVRPGGERGLTSILRRDRVLDAAGQEELRRVVRPSREFGGRAAPADASRPRESAGSWRESGSRAVRSDGSPVRERTGRSDEGWRSSTTVLPVPVERRGGESRERAGDSGWRAPAPRVIDRSGERPVARGNDAPARRDSAPSGREAPARSEPAHSAPAPVHSAPAYSAPAPAPVSAPVSAPAPAAAPA